MVAKSWRTTVGGLVAAVSYFLDQTVTPGLASGQFDWGPLFKPEFVGLLLDVITSAALIFTGLSTRDNKVTSEEAIGIPAVIAKKEEVRDETGVGPDVAINAAVRRP